MDVCVLHWVDRRQRQMCIRDRLLKNGVAKRIVIPDAKVVEVGEVVYKDDDVIGYPVTLSCLPDAEGNTHYEYIKKAT